MNGIDVAIVVFLALSAINILVLIGILLEIPLVVNLIKLIFMGG